MKMKTIGYAIYYKPTGDFVSGIDVDGSFEIKGQAVMVFPGRGVVQRTIKKDIKSLSLVESARDDYVIRRAVSYVG